MSATQSRSAWPRQSARLQPRAYTIRRHAPLFAAAIAIACAVSALLTCDAHARRRGTATAEDLESKIENLTEEKVCASLALLTLQVHPAIAAARAIKSSLSATAGRKGA